MNQAFRCDASTRPELRAAARNTSSDPALTASPFFSSEGGAQQDLFVEGEDAPLRFAAAEIADRIRTGRPVVRIDHGGDEVTVETTDGAVTADRVIVAFPRRLRVESATSLRFRLPATASPSIHRIADGLVGFASTRKVS